MVRRLFVFCSVYTLCSCQTITTLLAISFAGTTTELKKRLVDTLFKVNNEALGLESKGWYFESRI